MAEMHSRLYRASLGTAVMLVLLLRGPSADAQPTAAAPTLPSASRKAEAKKLTDEAIAAESVKNYTTAIALYEQAYRLVPHPILQFNIGQVHMITGNHSEAERYFRRYLERDPNGPGASIARKFLASLPVAGPSSPQAANTSRPASLTIMTSKPEAVPSNAAPTREQEPPAANGADVTTGRVEQRPQPIASAPLASDDGKDEHRRASRETSAEEQLKRATRNIDIGYTLIGVGVPIGVAAFAVVSAGNDELGLATSLLSAGFVCSGIVVQAYFKKQLRAAKAVAWSPVIGAGFAGVALAGSLP